MHTFRLSNVSSIYVFAITLQGGYPKQNIANTDGKGYENKQMFTKRKIIRPNKNIVNTDGKGKKNKQLLKKMDFIKK